MRGWILFSASALVGAALLTGCAAQRPYLSAGNAGLGQNPYQIGPVTVVVRSQPEVEMICRRSAPSFKHHFEGGWHD